MADSLIIKDGIGSIRNLQVDSGSLGYITNHTLISTVTGSSVKLYYTDGPDGWNWGDNKTPTIADANITRKGIVVQNNSEVGKCYILMGSSGETFGTISNITLPPSKYSFMLDSGATYFADPTTSALKHIIFVPSSSLIPNSSSMTVAVTEIY